MPWKYTLTHKTRLDHVEILFKFELNPRMIHLANKTNLKIHLKKNAVRAFEVSFKQTKNN